MMFNGQSFVSTSDFLSHLEKTETRVFQAGFQEVDNLAIVTSGWGGPCPEPLQKIMLAWGLGGKMWPQKKTWMKLGSLKFHDFLHPSGKDQET